MAMLEVDQLHVAYDLSETRQLHAVQGISFSVEPGEKVGLVGESGCGKTTALMALMGLLPASATVSGDVRLDGHSILADGEVGARPHRWREIAMVFQGAMNAFNPVRTIEWQIIEPMHLHGIAEGAAAKKRCRELLEMVGIPASAATRFPHEFSGGMRQRAVVAMALSCRPRVLLADEPTTALDTMVQAQILQLLDSLAADLDLAVVLVTHDLPIVAQTCARAHVMYAGRIVESGDLNDLFHDPWHPYTRLLFAATPDLYDDKRVVSIPGAPPPLDRVGRGCAFAPRCDRAFERCLVESPQLHGSDARRAACHLRDPAIEDRG